MSTYQQALELVGNLWGSELGTSLQTLRSIPSTDSRRFVDWFDSVGVQRQNQVVETLRKVGAAVLLRIPFDQVVEDESERALLAEVQAVSYSSSAENWWRYSSLRSLKMVVGFQRSASSALDEYDLPSEVAAWVSSIASAKATELRKLVNQVLVPRFGLVRKSAAGGEWQFQGMAENAPFTLELDYNGMDAQLRYWITLPNGVKRTSFEYTLGLIGVCSPTWNLIEATSALEKVSLLGDLVERVVVGASSLEGSSPAQLQ